VAIVLTVPPLSSVVVFRVQTAVPEHNEAFRASGNLLRELHALIKEKDPSFGNLVRVRNKRQEYLWVHPQFESEY
jgi:hypothetical protein